MTGHGFAVKGFFKTIRNQYLVNNMMKYVVNHSCSERLHRYLIIVGYVIAQVLGGIAAAGLLKFVGSMCNPAITGLGTNGYKDASYVGLNMTGALVVEIVLTCIFLIAILGVTSKESFSSVAGLVIGLTLTFVHIIGIPLTGTSVNPARSFGPALLAGGEALSQVWVFIVGPLVGAAIAALIWMFLNTESENK